MMDQNGKDDLKTQFITREGTYRLITLSEYSRPNRVGYQSNQNNPQVRVSLLPAKQNVDITKLSNPGTTPNVNNSTNSVATNPVVSQNTVATSNVAASSVVNGILDTALQTPQQCLSDKICFNFGKELYVYTYRGVKKSTKETVLCIGLLPAMKNGFIMRTPNVRQRMLIQANRHHHNQNEIFIAIRSCYESGGI
ncbi:WD repeat-containing protein 20 homolog isoform X2 [Sitodiplosis mosellana]|uniref:WD repeat-containing protein 20 homolog isoform X2 n=1 Tax=Sitodiplosis mosellana TaxID=263140 RepID=UPI002444229D|nr:WD repeat-containing protein 20 homolog isoform X2 [Sitodiplosis mosellana]